MPRSDNSETPQFFFAHRKLNVNFECPFAEGRGVGDDEALPLEDVLLVHHDLAKRFEAGLSDVLELLQVKSIIITLFTRLHCQTVAKSYLLKTSCSSHGERQKIADHS